MKIEMVARFTSGLLSVLLFSLAQDAWSADSSLQRTVVVRNGKPVALNSFIRLGAPLQAEFAGRWYSAQAIDILADGNVKVHWVGLSSQSDEILPRSRLLFADDPLAGRFAYGAGPGMAIRIDNPVKVVKPVPATNQPVEVQPNRPPRVNRADMAAMTPEQLIEILKQGETFSTRDALRELTSRRPKEPNAEVSQALEKLVLGSDFAIAWAAAEPWEHWATDESVPGLISALDNKSNFVTEPAMKALARLQPDEALEPLAAELAELSKAGEAAKALIAYGSKSEQAVLDLIKGTKDNFTIGRACKVLAEIGTTKSNSTLSALQKNFFTQREASAAMQSIRTRSPKFVPPKKST